MRHPIRRLMTLMATIVVALLALMRPAWAAVEDSTGSDPIPLGDFVAATNADKATITAVTGSPHDTLALYQVIVISYNTSNNTVSKQFSVAFQAYLNDDGTPEEFKTLDIAGYEALQESKLNELLSGYAVYVRNPSHSITPVQTQVTTDFDNPAGLPDDKDCYAEFTKVDLGQYIIVGTGVTNQTAQSESHNGPGTYIYQIMTATVQPYIDNTAYEVYQNYTLVLKTSRPDIEKLVTNKPSETNNSFSVGSIVAYQTTIDVPVYPIGAVNQTFFFCDEMDSGLEFDTTSVKVHIGTADGTVLENTDNKYYTLLFGTDTGLNAGATFQLNFTYDEVAAVASKLVITYEAKLTDEAAMGTNANNNKSLLVYTNSPYSGDTSTSLTTDGLGVRTSEATVSTYAICLHKQDSVQTSTALANATFEIYTAAEGGEPLKDADGNTIQLTTDRYGNVVYKGLALGTYYLQETIAPSGYTAPTERTPITVTTSNLAASTTTTTVTVYTTDQSKASVQTQAISDGSDGAVVGTPLWLPKGAPASTTPTPSAQQPEGDYVAAYVLRVETTYTAQSSTGNNPGYLSVLNIPNTKGGSLPTTGGAGAMAFYIVGAAIIAAALVGLRLRRRGERV